MCQIYEEKYIGEEGDIMEKIKLPVCLKCGKACLGNMFHDDNLQEWRNPSREEFLKLWETRTQWEMIVSTCPDCKQKYV